MKSPGFTFRAASTARHSEVPLPIAKILPKRRAIRKQSDCGRVGRCWIWYRPFARSDTRIAPNRKSSSPRVPARRACLDHALTDTYARSCLTSLHTSARDTTSAAQSRRLASSHAQAESGTNLSARRCLVHSDLPTAGLFRDCRQLESTQLRVM